ncbi:MAG: hypothetical protein IPH18_16815 [Chitinophagaceae bacterium]|nr:hypothetical protein [Chitinophagaceae bacterium]
MKTTTHFPSVIACAIMSFVILAPAPLLANISNPEDSLNKIISNNEDEKPAEKAKNKTTTAITGFSSRNNKVVNIYPDIIRRTMHVTVKNIEANKVSFQVFDKKGNLVKLYELKPKGHTITDGLKPGIYTYLVIVDEVESVKGLFEIR